MKRIHLFAVLAIIGLAAAIPVLAKGLAVPNLMSRLSTPAKNNYHKAVVADQTAYQNSLVAAKKTYMEALRAAKAMTDKEAGKAAARAARVAYMNARQKAGSIRGYNMQTAHNTLMNTLKQ